MSADSLATELPNDLPSAGTAYDITAEHKNPAATTPAPAGTPIPVCYDAAKLAATQTLAELTTMRVGGPCEKLLIATTTEQLQTYAAALEDSGEPWLLLAGGSNTIIADAGFPGNVLLVRTQGITEITDEPTPAGKVRLRVAAGHAWDDFVVWTVAAGYAGVEMLSGIPGLVGSAPVQNIGAYGGEIAHVLHSVRCFDLETRQIREFNAAQLELGYRTSIFKTGYRAVILSVDFLLANHSTQTKPLACPVVYPQLAKALNITLGQAVTLQQVREAVLRIRHAKAMVVTAENRNSWSAGSFFVNPVVSASFARTLPANAPKYPVALAAKHPLYTTFAELAAGEQLRTQNFNTVTGPEPHIADPASSTEQVKLSAAWLIENAGISKGMHLPGSGAYVSDYHTLAITNRGGASAADVAELARYIISMVQTEFGIILVPEPNIYGLEI